MYMEFSNESVWDSTGDKIREKNNTHPPVAFLFFQFSPVLILQISTQKVSGICMFIILCLTFFPGKEVIVTTQIIPLNPLPSLVGFWQYTTGRVIWHGAWCPNVVQSPKGVALSHCTVMDSGGFWIHPGKMSRGLGFKCESIYLLQLAYVFREQSVNFPVW